MPLMHSPEPPMQEPSSPSPVPAISPQIRIKNRRILYLERNPSYFTQPDLELLDPLLYDRCVRRFQTPTEREADGRAKGYSGVLEADLYRSEAKLAAVHKSLAQASSPSTSSSQDLQEPWSSSSEPHLPFVGHAGGKDGEELPEEEVDSPRTKEEGFERWKFEMTIRFLKGEDPDFDYRAIDETEEWDVIERKEEEERWFEDEEPSWVEGEGTGKRFIATPVAKLRLAFEMPPPLRCPSAFPSASSCARHLCKKQQSSRHFSSTPRHQQRTTRARRGLFRWLGTQGEALRNPLPGSTNYLGAYNAQGELRRVLDAARGQKNVDEGANSVASTSPKTDNPSLPPESLRDRVPFPLNRNFVSQPVLSEELREEIWRSIMRQGKSVREVSVEMRVEMSRVGAVVRLKEVEKQWKSIGKPLAKKYSHAVMSMLPQTPYDPGNVEHESINDLPVHASTGQQIFHPTSESRQFTRADAAKVFNERLLPADDRIPHPELVLQHRDLLEGLTDAEREEKARAREEATEWKRKREADIKAKKEAAVKKVDTGRWEFRFTDVNVDDAGKDGRGPNGVGWRYGAPHYDRARGQVKIPQSVE
ncbi:uncharacterized protein BP5553_01550 [Venustampulla echinocandica]|uniref:CCD97-like C-terminal domain-containing protein n=1 Tax=Venustampulla echinocandica TaxID=2656787 RepID=A0A370U1C3_9HELO|nr:uncharacterized protein BP5553_01550 [Venustampulla echinocandica]RDL41571.1 hypothetical protein BP5553_01550 [Venustampulla echinocandica]